MTDRKRIIEGVQVMDEDWVSKIQREAAEKIWSELEKPDDDSQMDDGDFFDPWNLFRSVYGSYSAEFDVCAIEVLEGLGVYNGTGRRDLASDFFREMLCTAEMCEYGSSPRACFPTSQFRGLLPKLIERWKAYYETKWNEPYPASE